MAEILHDSCMAVCFTQLLSMAISQTHNSQGGVATHFRCGGIFSNYCWKFSHESASEIILKISSDLTELPAWIWYLIFLFWGQSVC